MVTALPSPPAARRLPTLRSRPDLSWQLLAAGDQVSIGGAGDYEVIHLSEGRAWVSAMEDGSSRLVDAAMLTLLRPAGTVYVGRA